MMMLEARACSAEPDYARPVGAADAERSTRRYLRDVREPDDTRQPGSKGLLRRLAGVMLERGGDDLSSIARTANWDFAPDRLQAGNLSGSGWSESAREAIRAA